MRWPIQISAALPTDGVDDSEGDDQIFLRPFRYRDRAAWSEVRAINREWLTPWEATLPTMKAVASAGEPQSRVPNSYFQMVRAANREARAMRNFSFAIWTGSLESGPRRFVGQITLGGVVFGAYRGGFIGYWVDQRVANRGITTTAVCALTEFGFNELNLHRIEINLRPENEASKRVAEKSGYTYEGLRPRYLHINGEWRDHLSFVKENSAIN